MSTTASAAALREVQVNPPAPPSPSGCSSPPKPAAAAAAAATATESVATDAKAATKKQKRLKKAAAAKEAKERAELAAESIAAINRRRAATVEELLRIQFPAKIVELDNILATSFPPGRELPDADAGCVVDSSLELEELTRYKGAGKKRKRGEAAAAAKDDDDLDQDDAAPSSDEKGRFKRSPCNQKLVALGDIVTAEIKLLIGRVGMIKVWIQLLIPRMEDGNNFGVGIQEEAVAEASRVEGDLMTYLNHQTSYHMGRANLIAKVFCFPHLEDFAMACKEVDKKQFYSLRIILQEVMNCYLILSDLLTKNIEKIKCPRTNHAKNTMY